MTDSGMTSASQPPIEVTLADELARGDVVLGAAGPMLGMLVLNHDSALFSDEIVARVRGMCRHVAQQVSTVRGTIEGGEDPDPSVARQGERLAEALSGDMEFLGHCHALTLEHRLAMQLERRHAIDPVISPMLQARIAARDADTARLATALLAAQARFDQQQRRAELPVMELPPSLFERTLLLWREQATGTGDVAAERAGQHLREAYDPHGNRLALLLRLVRAIGGEPMHALSLDQAGAAAFLSALAWATGQNRDLLTMTTSDSQTGRFALALCAAGLTTDQIAEQFALIHPGVPVPDTMDVLDADRAAAILAASGRQTMG